MRKGIILTGPTASGKSNLAIKMALKMNGEIINCDSRQIYSELPIISAQPSEDDYKIVKHHLYGHKNIADDYSVGKWLDDAKIVIDDVCERGKLPIVVGGTGMYVNALYYGIADIPDVAKEYVDKATEMLTDEGNVKFYERLTKIANNLTFDHTNTHRMIRFMSVYLAHKKSMYEFFDNTVKVVDNIEWQGYLLSIPRSEVYENCNQRFLKMWDSGLLDEIKAIIDAKIDSSLYAKSIGVKEIAEYLNGTLPKDDAIKIVQQKTRNYAKRQLTWFNNKSPFLDKIPSSYFD